MQIQQNKGRSKTYQFHPPWVGNTGGGLNALTAILSLGVDLGPVLEFIGVKLSAEIGDTLLHACLGIVNRLVVDDGAELFQKEVEQQAGGQLADWFVHVFVKVTLHGSDGRCARLLGYVDRHGRGVLLKKFYVPRITGRDSRHKYAATGRASWPRRPDRPPVAHRA